MQVEAPIGLPFTRVFKKLTQKYLVGLRCVVFGSLFGLFSKILKADTRSRSMSDSLSADVEYAKTNKVN
jgi:hypothetical protein